MAKNNNYLELKGNTINTRYFVSEKSRDEFYDKKKKEKNSFLRTGIDAKMAYEGYKYFVSYDKKKKKKNFLNNEEQMRAGVFDNKDNLNGGF